MKWRLSDYIMIKKYVKMKNLKIEIKLMMKLITDIEKKYSSLQDTHLALLLEYIKLQQQFLEPPIMYDFSKKERILN